MRIRTQCRACGLPFGAVLEPPSPGAPGELPCPQCDAVRPVASEGWTDGAEARVEVCPLCGCRHLYRQRDFNRAMGCALVAAGAALVPWTFGLSLPAFGLVDLWLWRRLKDAVVCYRCDTVYRDACPGPRQGDFDLLKHDVLKYGKNWADTSTPGPLSHRPPTDRERGNEDRALESTATRTSGPPPAGT